MLVPMVNVIFHNSLFDLQYEGIESLQREEIFYTNATYNLMKADFQPRNK